MTHLNNQEISNIIRQPHSSSINTSLDANTKAKAKAFLALSKESHPSNPADLVGSTWSSQPGSRETSTATHHQFPSSSRTVTVHDTTVPAPSTLFTSAMELFRRTHHGTTRVTEASGSLQSTAFPHQSMVAQIPSVTGTLHSASKTRLQNHQRQMRKLQKNNTIPNLAGSKSCSPATSSDQPSWRRQTLDRLTRMLQNTGRACLPSAPDSKEDTSTNMVVPVTFSSSVMTPCHFESDSDVLMEFDHDVAEAILSAGGQYLNIPPAELIQSTGLRKLVARNIRWFQRTPDCVKLMGLMLAKKVNGMIHQNRHVKRTYSQLVQSASTVSDIIGSMDQPTQEWHDLPDVLPDENNAVVELSTSSSSSSSAGLPTSSSDVSSSRSSSTNSEGDQNEPKIDTHQDGEVEPPKKKVKRTVIRKKDRGDMMDKAVTVPNDVHEPPVQSKEKKSSQKKQKDRTSKKSTKASVTVQEADVQSGNTE